LPVQRAIGCGQKRFAGERKGNHKLPLNCYSMLR
jgi:hypothetical protein